MTKLDLTKPVQTRDGRTVRILCTDRKGEYPVVGLIILSNGQEISGSWNTCGRFNSLSDDEHDIDLINVPPKPVKYYGHVYLVGTSLIAGDICVDDGPRKPPAQNIGWKFIETIEFEV